MKSNRANIIAASIYLPFGHLWYGEPKALSNAIACAKHDSRSRPAVIRVYDVVGNVIETHDHACEYKEWWRSTAFTDYSARFAVQVSSVQGARSLLAGPQ
jgi:hypothetical protein